MSTIDVIRSMGAEVAFVDGAVEVIGLDVLPADVAEHVIAVAREHKEELARELGASAPGPVTGLEWISKPTDPDAPGYDSQWAAFDLADLGNIYSIRVARAGERVLAVYPPELEPELVAYASELLAEARDFLRQHMDRLPVLEPAAAVEHIMEIMREHPGLRFTRGDDGSRWPIYPKTWTAGQRATSQALWFAAGDALDRDDFTRLFPGDDTMEETAS